MLGPELSYLTLLFWCEKISVRHNPYLTCEIGVAEIRIRSVAAFFGALGECADVTDFEKLGHPIPFLISQRIYKADSVCIPFSHSCSAFAV